MNWSNLFSWLYIFKLILIKIEGFKEKLVNYRLLDIGRLTIFKKYCFQITRLENEINYLAPFSQWYSSMTKMILINTNLPTYKTFNVRNNKVLINSDKQLIFNFWYYK